MDGAKPGHTVKFQGLKGADHLNGQEGTLVKYVKKEGRWSVRCEDGNTVNAKPENLLLHRNYAPSWKNDGEHLSFMGPGGSGTGRVNTSASNDPSHWAKGLSTKDQYEWFSNCYQMRCDDDYAWGGCNLHGPYDPDATSTSIADDFLIFCLLAHQVKALPNDWDWKAYLKVAPQFIVFAFEKSDAKERWGSENFFEGEMGGRSLRYTARKICGSDVNVPGDSGEYKQAKKDVKNKKKKAAWEDKLGGQSAWNGLVDDMSKGSRFSR